MITDTILDSLSDQQRAPVLTRGANVLVEAAPGSGKTRVIIARCVHLLQSGVDPANILLLTFSRRAVGELRARLRAQPDIASLPDVRTFHGFASRLLSVEGRGFRNRRLLSPPAQAMVFAEAVKGAAFRGFPTDVARSQRFQRDAQLLVAELARCDDDSRAALDGVASPRLGDLIAIHQSLRQLRDRLGIADYDDLVAQAAGLARSSESQVHHWLQGRFQHILVDEFQDTDPLQLSLLESLHGEVFAVGDAAQAIYGFRGAARNAISLAAKLLQMRRFELGETFRCSPAVCALAEATPFLPGHAALQPQRAGSRAVEFRQAATPFDEATLIAERVARAIFDEKLPAGDVGVLLRNFEPIGPLVVAELERRRLPVSHAGGTSLLQDPLIGTIVAGLKLLQSPSNRASWIQLLASPVLGFPQLAVRLAFGDDKQIEELAAGLERLEPVRGSGHLNVIRFGEALREAQEHWNAGAFVDATRTLARGWDVLGWLVNGSQNEDAIRNASARLKQFLDGISDMSAVRTELGLSTSCAALLDALVENGEQWTDAGQEDSSVDAVRVLTIHSAKGLEFEFTVVADAVEGHLPQQYQTAGMLSDSDMQSARRLGIDLGTTPEEHISEEASLWYVGVTRAKGTLLVTCAATDIDGAPQVPSRFIPREHAGRFEKEPPFRAPFTYDPDEGWRKAQEPAAITLPAQIAVTSVDTWLKCKRQFFYKTVLGLSTSDAPLQTTMGNHVHKVLERFHASRKDFTRVSDGDVALWKTELCELRARVWDENSGEFGTPLQATAAARTADRLLSAYAESLLQLARSAPFTVRDVERSFEFVYAGIGFKGRVDRVDEYTCGSLAIRDYKSGATDGPQAKKIDKLVEAADAGTIWVKGPPSRLYTQLAIYRHAPELAQAREVSLIYLSGKKQPVYAQPLPVEIDTLQDGEVLGTLDKLLHALFFSTWQAEVLELEPTGDAQQCLRCDYQRLCPGALDLTI